MEEVAVNCDDLVSQITSDECMRKARMYGLYVTLSEIYLRFRVRFLLNPFFVAVLRYFELTVFQITPNG